MNIIPHGGYASIMLEFKQDLDGVESFVTNHRMDTITPLKDQDFINNKTDYVNNFVLPILRNIGGRWMEGSLVVDFRAEIFKVVYVDEDDEYHKIQFILSKL